jgi:hypothetical protein
MDRIFFVEKKCLQLVYERPAYGQPYDGGNWQTKNAITPRLEIKPNSKGPHFFDVTHEWEMVDSKGRQIVRFACCSKYGFLMSRPFMSHEEIPLPQLIEMVHLSISHTRAILAHLSFEAGHNLRLVEFLATERFRPMIDTAILEAQI